MVKAGKGGAGGGRARGTGSAHGTGGARSLSVRVKTAKGRKIASTRWLQRQLNDPYVEAAKREGFRSRAAFKLTEIDDKHRLLKPGMVVLDLGAAPGGWSQVAAARVGAGDGTGRVIAVDLSAIDPVPDVEALVLDMSEPESGDRIKEALGGALTDVVLSDMAASSTGHRQIDHLRVVALAESALDIAEEVLKPGGTFLAKVLQGGADKTLLERLKQGFAQVKHIKPKASRADSAEVYVLATDFRGARGAGT
jgi:23S rRNA (uridine2552-2'-O)-methyltransferase